MPSGEEEIRGLSITFSQTTRHHSGIYTCSADNGFGFSANATIVLDVQRKFLKREHHSCFLVIPDFHKTFEDVRK